ncbi:MAG: LPP20 family lipoprotein [Halobacteriovoraceae bacterium]|nr:LPP20 family lipoprotein [Halobacteriovoraceae bacterium]
MKHLICLIMLLSLPVFGKGEPKWVKNPEKACKKSELCAVGEGTGLSGAKRAARLAIGKIFGTRIKSEFKEKIASMGKTVSQEMSDEVQELTDIALEGVNIKKTYETKTGWFALASLNKRKTANSFKREIDKLDEKMLVLMDDATAGSLMKVEPLYIKREELNSRYAFLTGQAFPPVISYEDVFKGKRAATGSMIVHIYLDEKDPKEVEKILAKALSDRGYKTTSGRKRNKNSTHIVSGELSTEKQYLKVDGFEKWKFLFSVKAKTSAKVESGVLNHAVTTTGRSFEQAKERALPEMEEFIKKNIDKLNIE